jgi:hypothetical protein
MMAVAALSLAHREGNERLDALQHYQKALPALQSNLRSTGDLSSDGAFLTHFLLLVYEVRLRFLFFLVPTSRLVQGVSQSQLERSSRMIKRGPRGD